MAEPSNKETGPSSPPAVNPYKKKGMSSPPVVNPYKKKKGTLSTPVANPYKQESKSPENNKENAGTNNQFDASTPNRFEENRKRALKLLQESQKRKRLAAECSRCHQPASHATLCIVWKHSGEIQRERGFRGDNFRYRCCGRLDPQPCFVGNHVKPGEVINRHVQTIVHCDCGGSELAQFRRARKGLNAGRYFYRCGTSGPDGCNFFLWADQAHGLPRSCPMPAADGILEYIYPHADPLGEDLCHHSAVVHADQARNRILAACLIKQMVLNVTGPFVSSQATPEHIIEKVQAVYKEKKIVKHLYPLKLSQMEERFGVQDLNVLQVPTEAECNDMINQVLERNPVLQSTVSIQTLHGMHEGRRLVDLTGLESYMSI